MRISRKCQYALRAVFELALRSSSDPVKIGRIADTQNIPPRFLEIILNELRHAGLVSSRRGKEGGYLLAKAPEELTVSQVIRQIEGPQMLRSDEAGKTKATRYYRGDYAFERLWQQIDKAICEVCENTNFDELVGYELSKRPSVMPDYVI